MGKVAQLREMREAQARSTRLAELESTIEKSAQAVWDMAKALKEIREDELWKETHDTWAGYCEDRWDVTKRWANQMIDAIRVRAELAGGNSSSRLPTHVRQTAELGKIPKEDRAAVWDRALEKAKEDNKEEPSLHRHVTPAIQEYREKAAPAPPPPSPADEAHEAAERMRAAAEAFTTSVERLMSHLDHLSEDETQGCAYKVVETVHSVMTTLREHGQIREDVARNAIGLPEGREIVVS